MVYYNDNDGKCCQVLRKNIALGNLPEGLVDERDIREISGEELRNYRHIHLFAGIGGFPLGLTWANWPENLSIVTGGFPCQPYSIAGKRRGKADDRYLWPEMLRIIREVKPRWVFAENVLGILTSDNGLVIEEVLSSLENAGYETIPSFIIPACAVDAWHRRDRVWIIAHNDEVGGDSQIISDTNSEGLQESKQKWITSGSIAKCRGWLPESGLVRVATGIPGRLDRLKQLGNSVVPQVVEMIGRAILATEGANASACS